MDHRHGTPVVYLSRSDVSREEAEQKLREAVDEYFAPAKTEEQGE